jgi:uncharacterized membrane protein
MRWLEVIFGLERGFLSREGELVLRFDPPWPHWSYFPPAAWNILLTTALVALVVWIYQRETLARSRRIVLGALRGALLLLLLVMLNRPMATLVQTRAEPSLLALLVDDSASMGVPDVREQSRLSAVQQALTPELLADVGRTHHLKLYRFSETAAPVPAATQPATRPAGEGEGDAAGLARSLAALEPRGQATRLSAAVLRVAQELQGQRLAGVVLFSDGREVPAASPDPRPLREMSVRVYSVPVGTESRLRNVAIAKTAMQDVVFQGDLASVHVVLSASGVEAGETLRLIARDARTGEALKGEDGRDVVTILRLAGDGEIDADLSFRAATVGTQDVLIEALPLDGELTAEDNSRRLQASVLDARIAVLYIEGAPRWEYRYLRNQLTRDKTIDLSCLLTSADPGFAQEGDRPIRYFPQTMDQLLEYDLVLIGDVDPRQFSDATMQLLQEYVMRKGGGLGMIAGPRFSPHAYRNTPIETILPVNIGSPAADAAPAPFRPLVTPEGELSPIFRFFGEREKNRSYIREELPMLFWYARGVSARSGVGEVFAEHPVDSGPDGKKAPLLVAGRPGAGRSLFSAIDESWRWRYYTGESIFDTYWVQQVRYLARGRKVGQRRLAFTSLRPVYEIGEEARVSARILDDTLAATLPDALAVELRGADGRLLQMAQLTRQPGQRDLFSLAMPTDRAGRFSAVLPSVAPGVPTADTPFEVISPRLELADVRLARSALAELSAETEGKLIDLSTLREQLLAIPSAGRLSPISTAQPIWSSGIVLGVLALLLTAEWTLRKLSGLL